MNTAFFINGLIKKLTNRRRFLLLLLVGTVTIVNAQDFDEAISDLDSRYQDLTAEVYLTLSMSDKSQKSGEDNFSDTGLEHTLKQAQDLISKHNHLAAMTYIYSNIETIRYELDNPLIFDLIELLLKFYQYEIAHSLFLQIQEGGERFFIANAALKFAQYHNSRAEWQQTIELLDIDLEELTKEDTNQVHLLIGIALQNLGKHRESIKEYRKVTTDSPQYLYAQLNSAVAHIRQDWWTDAHLIINELLKDPNRIEDEELKNRLSVILGYSLLNKGYYRESRNSFRSINLDSRYTSTALLGISLVAVNQDDSSGALNALTILKERKNHELPVEEAHLLIPHIYRNLEQYATANAGYSDAIKYYQDRIAFIEQQLENVKTYDLNALGMNEKTVFSVADTPLVFTDLFPKHFLNSFKDLKYLQQSTNDPQLISAIDVLHKDYQYMFNLMVKSLLTTRINALDSYLNQAQYAIAQLYDKSSKQKE